MLFVQREYFGQLSDFDYFILWDVRRGNSVSFTKMSALSRDGEALPQLC
jgi:hypothetical protein